MRVDSAAEEVGRKYGRWTVLSTRYDNGLRKRFLLCVCECGVEREVMKGNIKAGGSQSCGCLRKELASAAFRKLPIKESTAKQHYQRYKRSAEVMGREFSLSSDQFHSVSSGRCFYCGQEAQEFQAKSMGSKVSSGYIANGLDRINSSIGYTIDNVVACCFKCNAAKSDMLQSEFIGMCLNVARIHGGE